MSSCVRLAAMMPAIRAAASTSPFGALPSMTSASVAGRIVTSPGGGLARVTALSETSTIRARPSSSRWVSRDLAMLTPSDALAGLPRIARVAASTSRCRIRLSPIRKALIPARASRARSAGVPIPLSAMPIAPRGTHRRQPLGGLEPRLEGPEIAIVDADQPGLSRSARSSSGSSWTSHSTSMPCLSASASSAAAAASSIIAMIRRMQSAPSARASTT